LRFNTSYGKGGEVKRITLLVTLLVVFTLSLGAHNVGLSIGVFGAPPNNVSFEDGPFIQSGVVVGLSPRFEAEAQIIAKVTPTPFSQLFASVNASYALISSVFEGAGDVPSYANAYLSLGVMGDVLSLQSYGPFVRITPLSVGGPQFKLRERTLSMGVYYDIPASRVTFFWNLFHLDFFGK